MSESSAGDPPPWRVVGPLELTLGLILALDVFLMMGLTFVDVVGRFFFNAPLKAAYELTEFTVALVFFLGLPLVTAQEQHVSVSMFDHLFRGARRRIQLVVIDLVCAAVMGVLAWRLWLQGSRLDDANAVSAFLQIPTGPLGWVMSVMSAGSMVLLLLLAVRHARGIEPAKEAGV